MQCAVSISLCCETAIDMGMFESLHSTRMVRGWSEKEDFASTISSIYIVKLILYIDI